ncbi:MAG TPA: hypothetical protein VFH23_01535 [Jiangellaceae bacterium]|nr:hypothetical protein [Jiangellaceae bacterium]
MEKRRGHRSWWVAAAIAVAALAACGGAKGDDNGEERFGERLATVVEPASAGYGELGERSGSVNPNAPLPDDFKAQMRAVAEGDRRAADEIEALTPPQAAAELIQQLGAALRARAGAFERAAGATISLQQLEEEGSITEAGEQIDRVLQQLREAGFLPDEQPHNEP